MIRMVIKTCVVCKRKFDAKGCDKTCSHNCSKKLQSKRMKDWYEKNRKNRLKYYYEHKQYIIKECVICSGKFSSKRRRGAKTCSKQCSEELHKKLKERWIKDHPNYAKKHSRERIRELKKKFVKMLGGKCQNPDCSTPDGYSRYIGALEFHHLNPDEKESEKECRRKDFEGKIKTGKIKLFCSNCHREEHHEK